MVRNAAWWRGTMRPAELKLFCAGMAAYIVLLLVGRAVVQEEDPAWQRSLLAVALIGVAAITVGVSFRSALRTREVDRIVVSEGAAWSFFATMIAALSYGLLEAITGAPRPSAWFFWAFGMTVWAVSTSWFRRKLF